MNQIEKKDFQKLSVPKLAQVLNNIGEACRHQNTNLNQFYEYKQLFQSSGLESLSEVAAQHRPHPKATSAQIIEKIVNLSLAHPAWGCIRISNFLKTQGIQISSPTVQSILIKNGMGNRYERLQKLEEKALQNSVELSTEQLNLIERVNPCFRQYDSKSSYPGELLAQDTIYIGHLNSIGKIYAQIVIDTFENYAFGFLHTGKLPACAVAILYNEVLPFYAKLNFKVKSILTDNGREYCGKERHHYEIYLKLNDIEHLKTEIRQPGTNCFVKRFNYICQNEFFKKVFQEKPYMNVADLQADFDQWLIFYNFQRRNYSSPNMGKPPMDMILNFK